MKLNTEDEFRFHFVCHLNNRSMSTPQRHHGPPEWACRRGKVRAAARTILQFLDEESHRSEWREANWQRRQQTGWAPKREPRMFSRPPPRRFQGTPWPGRWRQPSGGDRRWGGTPNHFPQRVTPRTGDPVCCPGEALLWQPSESPDGPAKKDCAGGSLAGQNPEALCGEAPKGQPKIRRGNLKADCGEAPKGQPRIHSCCTRTSHKPRPRAEERGSKTNQDQPSTRWMKVEL